MSDPPAEILYLRGPGELQTARHTHELDSGCWLLVRWPLGGEAADGQMAEYPIPRAVERQSLPPRLEEGNPPENSA